MRSRSEFRAGVCEPVENDPRNQSTCQHADGGDAPVSQVVVDQNHGAYRCKPDGVAAVAQIHPAKKEWKLKPDNDAEKNLRPGGRQLPVDKGQYQYTRQCAHQAPHPDALVSLGIPDDPDPAEKRLTQHDP